MYAFTASISLYNPAYSLKGIFEVKAITGVFSSFFIFIHGFIPPPTSPTNKRKNNDSAIILTVRGSAPSGNSPFRCTAKAIYKITEEGRRIAPWDSSWQHTDLPNASSANLTKRLSVGHSTVENGEKGSNAKIHRRISMVEELNAHYKAAEKKHKESNRSGSNTFLKNRVCGHCSDFKCKFNNTSSAIAVNPPPHTGSRQVTPGQQAMEHHRESLINTAFVIYNMYLAPSSQCELNIDHGLQNEPVKYLKDVVTSLMGKAFQGRVELGYSIHPMASTNPLIPSFPSQVNSQFTCPTKQTQNKQASQSPTYPPFHIPSPPTSTIQVSSLLYIPYAQRVLPHP
ncbi:hypothetical protein K435DRAFT_854099 [Dendrothele bispora CBS 962.96]|uniref:Uncharacterized protein n=1 Tax=Dendrothele bispora (strain CBS 962.96) TaxID=1314807 RepID=A0A4S8MET0_DENBC|nr:hypothetical protein K435DRAFT_854099 [Dendrothele bispora CBS 962.96]